jgi:aldehyde:ferredoxin oxidoreductase
MPDQETQMKSTTQAAEPTEKRHYRGPLPPWSAKVDLATWLEMPSEERAGHIRRDQEREREHYLSCGFSEAKIEHQTARTIAYWDHFASLLAMGSQERAEHFRTHAGQYVSEGLSEAERARRTEGLIQSWDAVAATRDRRSASGEQAP